MRLCTEFIAKFEAKMNQLRFVQILCAVGKTCSGVLWTMTCVGSLWSRLTEGVNSGRNT